MKEKQDRVAPRTAEDIDRKYNITRLMESEKSRKSLLWSGTWENNGATIWVENTDKYMLFKIGLKGQGTSILAMRHGDFIRGIGGTSTETSTVITFHFAATVDGDIWSLVACNCGRPFTDGTLEPLTVTSIVGII